jgi:hypothetical protein
MIAFLILVAFCAAPLHALGFSNEASCWIGLFLAVTLLFGRGFIGGILAHVKWTTRIAGGIRKAGQRK